MAVTVKKITLWRCEVDNRPGSLADTLEPLADTGLDLQVLMGYGYPGRPDQAAIELFPVSGKKPTSAARSGGLNASAIPTLLVQGDNRAGLGYSLARALAEAGINIDFLVAQVIGRKYSAVFGFGSEPDAAKAATLIKKTAGGKKR